MRDAFGQPQTAILFGGTSAIGLAIVDRLVDARLRHVVLVGRNATALEDAAAALHSRSVTATVVLADAADGATARGAVDQAFAALGTPCDLVIMAVGLLGDQSKDDDDPDRTATMFTVNTAWPAAVLAGCRAALVAQGTGQIVVLSSVAALRTRRANYTYGAGKQGLDGFTLGLAESLRGTGVTVHLIRPGFVTTKMTEHLKAAPFSTTAPAVADVTVAAIAKGAPVAYAPGILRYVFLVLRHLPSALWRKIPG